MEAKDPSGAMTPGAAVSPSDASASKSRLILQSAAIAGGWVPLAIAAGQSVALRMDDLGASTAVYSLIVAGGWAVSMVSLPAMGHLADNAVRRGIDRRLLLVIGGIAMLACFALLGAVHSIATFALVWLIAQIPTSLIVTAASSRLANEAPVELRGWASTAAGVGPVLAITIGAITTLALSSVPSVLFIAPAIVGAILLIPSLAMRPLPTFSSDGSDSSAVRSTRLYPWSLLIAIALAFSGLAVGRVYLVPLIESVSSNASDTEVTALASTTLLVATIGALVGTVVAGKLMRRGERALGTFGWFSLASAIPLAIFAFLTTTGQVIAVGLLLGFAIGAINAAAYGIYLHRYAHRTDPGRILGLIVAAETVPYVIVPLSAAAWQASADAALIPVLFVIGAVLAIAASVLTLTKVR
jgi:MFS family permease